MYSVHLLQVLAVFISWLVFLMTRSLTSPLKHANNPNLPTELSSAAGDFHDKRKIFHENLNPVDSNPVRYLHLFISQPVHLSHKNFM